MLTPEDAFLDIRGARDGYNFFQNLIQKSNSCVIVETIDLEVTISHLFFLNYLILSFLSIEILNLKIKNGFSYEIISKNVV